MLMKDRNLLLLVLHPFFNVFNRDAMVVVAFKVPSVPLYLSLGNFLFTRHFFDFGVDKLIAIVVIAAMLFPRAHAHPTTLVLALTTCHVVAATVLLDWFLTARAGFCVRLNPEHVL